MKRHAGWVDDHDMATKRTGSKTATKRKGIKAAPQGRGTRRTATETRKPRSATNPVVVAELVRQHREGLDPATLIRRVRALVSRSSVPEVLEALVEVCAAEGREDALERQGWATVEAELRRALKAID